MSWSAFLMLTGRRHEYYKENIGDLWVAGKGIGLEINDENFKKCSYVSTSMQDEIPIKIATTFFEHVTKFVYLCDKNI